MSAKSAKTMNYVDYKQSSRTTIRLSIGDVYLRRKGNGWTREIVNYAWVDGHLYLNYVEYLNDKTKPYPGCCSVYALLKWGKKIEVTP